MELYYYSVVISLAGDIFFAFGTWQGFLEGSSDFRKDRNNYFDVINSF